MTSLFIGSFYIHIHLIIIVWPPWQFTKKWSAQHHQARVRDYEPHVGREVLTISSVRRALSMQILTRFLAANDQAQG